MANWFARERFSIWQAAKFRTMVYNYNLFGIEGCCWRTKYRSQLKHPRWRLNMAEFWGFLLSSRADSPVLLYPQSFTLNPELGYMAWVTCAKLFRTHHRCQLNGNEAGNRGTWILILTNQNECDAQDRINLDISSTRQSAVLYKRLGNAVFKVFPLSARR